MLCVLIALNAGAAAGCCYMLLPVLLEGAAVTGACALWGRHAGTAAPCRVLLQLGVA